MNHFNCIALYHTNYILYQHQFGIILVIIYTMFNIIMYLYHILIFNLSHR